MARRDGSTTTLPAVAYLEAIVDEDVEALRLELLNPTWDVAAARIEAYEAILQTLQFSVPGSIRGKTAEQIRALAGTRPHARARIVQEVFVDRTSSGEISRMGGPSDDLQPDETMIMVRRAQALLAARIMEELART